MYIKTEYPFYWKLNFVPIFYEGLSEEQLRDQRIVLNFKEGIYDDDTMLWFRQKVWSLSKGDDYGWAVCFMPCHNSKTQKKRFSKLADYLRKTTRVKVCFPFSYAEDRLPSHLNGKTEIDIMDIAINQEEIYTNNLILIDDIITTGQLFNQTAAQALRMGANSIHGLFLAKTIHPDLPMKEKNSHREDDDSIIREEAEIMNKLSNLPPEDN